MEISQKHAGEVTNVKSALKHVLKQPATPKKHVTAITAEITGYRLQILTVWSWHKEINVPAVKQTSQEASTTNGASITTMSLA